MKTLDHYSTLVQNKPIGFNSPIRFSSLELHNGRYATLKRGFLMSAICHAYKFMVASDGRLMPAGLHCVQSANPLLVAPSFMFSSVMMGLNKHNGVNIMAKISQAFTRPIKKQSIRNNPHIQHNIEPKCLLIIGVPYPHQFEEFADMSRSKWLSLGWFDNEKQAVQAVYKFGQKHEHDCYMLLQEDSQDPLFAKFSAMEVQSYE